MFQLYLSCLLLTARAAPPLDTRAEEVTTEVTTEVTITTEAVTLGTELETEAVSEENDGAAGTPAADIGIDDTATTATITEAGDNFIVATKEEDNEDGGELISAKHHQNDIAENLISNDTDQKNTIEPWMSGKERRGLVSHLRDLDLDTGAALVLTPRQKLALRQELATLA